jgi:hypothetical protein
MGALTSFFMFGQVAPKMKLPTNLAPKINTPDCVDTRVESSVLRTVPGRAKTTQLVHDNLDFMSGEKKGHSK